MKIFTLQNNYPSISEEAILIKEFKAIWDRDKSKDKEKALSELAYVYYLSDYKSVYAAYSPKDREEQIIQDIIMDSKWEPDEVIKAACAKYEELQNTPTLRFLKSQINALESLSDYFNGIDWEDETYKGIPKYKLTEVTRAVKDAGGIIASLERLEEKVKKEEAVTESRSRGGGEQGFFEE
jgi:hypothetical protein